MKVDIAILTIREDEFRAVRTRFQTERRRIPDGRTYLIGEVKTEKQTYTIAIARCIEQGNDASQRLTNHIIHNLDPRLILVVGVAGGIPRDEFTLGDVVISTRIVNPNVDAWHPDGTIDYATRGGPPHPLVENIVSLLPGEPQLARWTETIQLERPTLDPEQENIAGDDEWREKVRQSLNWHFGEAQNRGRPPTFMIGPILSSNHLMKDPARLREILKTHRAILAVEMEVAGVYEAAQGVDHQYPVMAIRGISDIVGLQRDSKWTEYACQTAAAFTYAFIMADPLDPPLNSASFHTPVAPSEISSAQLRGSKLSLDTQHSGWHRSWQRMTAGVFLPSAQTTLLIVLGASEYPEAASFEPRKDFANAAKSLKDYFLSVFSLPQENMLDLFDSDDSPSEQEKCIGEFLRRRTTELQRLDSAARDVIIYFVGHGGLTRENQYHLFIRHTQEPGPLSSKLLMLSLAGTIKENARNLRRILILDSCFSGAAVTHLLGAPETEVAIRQTEIAFVEKDTEPAPRIPEKGTSLLCAASQDNPSITLRGASLPTFSEALLYVLLHGDSHSSRDYLTLHRIHGLTTDYLDAHYGDQVYRPVILSPDQSQGLVEDVPFFPNMARIRGQSAQVKTAEEQEAASLVGEPGTSSHLLGQPALSPPPPLLRFAWPFHIRTVIFYLNRPISIILILLLLTSTGVLAFYFSSLSKTPPATNTKLDTTTISPSTCNANTPVPSTVNASTQAYTNYVASNGIMFGFNPQRTHSNPYEGFLTPSTVGHLICYWRASTTGPIVYSSPAVANGVVYIGSQDSKLYAFKLDKCRSTDCPILWMGKTGELIDSSPAVVNNIVYIGSHDRYLYAFKADGCGQRICDPLWQAQTKGTIGSSPIVVNGVAYIGSDDENLYAFKADGCGQATCDTLWKAQTGACVCSSPTIANHLVYVSSDRLYVFKADGCGQPICKPQWTATLGQGTSSSVAISNGIAYVGAGDGKLYAFKANGCGYSICSPLWTAQTGDAISSSPAVVNNVVYVGSYDHYLYAFKADGCNHPHCPPLWTAQTGDRIYSSPTVANDVVYIGSDDMNLYAFKADGCGRSTCSPLWTYLTGGAIRSSPAVSNGVVYIGSTDNDLYAFSLHN